MDGETIGRAKQIATFLQKAEHPELLIELVNENLLDFPLGLNLFYKEIPMWKKPLETLKFGTRNSS